MRHVNIMVDVPDDLYNTTIEPLKRQKKFTKVVTNLLKGMQVDEYIAQFAEGSLERLNDINLKRFKKEHTKDISSLLDEIMEVSETMGMAAEEGKSIVNSGLDAVNLDKNRAKWEDTDFSNEDVNIYEKDINNTSQEQSMSQEVLLIEAKKAASEEFSKEKSEYDSKFKDMQDEIATMQKMMREQSELLMNFMKGMTQGGVSQASSFTTSEEKKEQVIKEEIPKTEKVNKVEKKLDKSSFEEKEEIAQDLDSALDKAFVEEEPKEKEQNISKKVEDTTVTETPVFDSNIGKDDDLGDDIVFGDEEIDIFGDNFEEEEDEESDEDFLNGLIEGQEYSF